MSDKTRHSLRDTAETFPSKLPKQGEEQNGNRESEEGVIFGPDNRPVSKRQDMETSKEIKPKSSRDRDLLTEKDQDYVPNLKRLADLDVDYYGKKK